MLITWNGVQGLTITPMGMRLIVIEKRFVAYMEKLLTFSNQ